MSAQDGGAGIESVRKRHRADSSQPDLGSCEWCREPWPCPIERVFRQRDAAEARAEVAARWSARWRSLADLYRTAARDYAGMHDSKMAAEARAGRAEGEGMSDSEAEIFAAAWTEHRNWHRGPWAACMENPCIDALGVLARPGDAGRLENLRRSLEATKGDTHVRTDS